MGGRTLLGDLLLGGHGFPITGFFHRGGYLVWHLGGAAPGLLGIGEDAQAVELGLADKIQKGGKLGIGFAREARDERGTNGQAGNAGAEFSDQFADVGFRGLPAHVAQHPLFHVLEGHVDIARDLGQAGDRCDQLVRPVGGVGVEEPDPKLPLDRMEGLQ